MGTFLNPSLYPQQHRVLPKSLPARIPLFKSDFDHDSDFDWLEPVQGDWYLSGGALHGSGAADAPGGVLLIRGLNALNVKVEVLIQIVADDDIPGVLLRYSSTKSLYLLCVSSLVNELEIDKYTGSWTVINTTSFPTSTGVWYRVVAWARGDTLGMTANGTPLTGSDSPPLTGSRVGLRFRGGYHSIFDQLCVFKY